MFKVGLRMALPAGLPAQKFGQREVRREGAARGRRLLKIPSLIPRKSANEKKTGRFQT